jgi:regulator of sirC expression with transglutaminase-like and TPR domain
MNAKQRFAAAVAGASADVRLDEAAFCIAACAHPGLDVDEWCDRLDVIASGCDATFDAIRVHLAETLEFRGNTEEYGDPENSFLDSVITRRVGIPITLSVLMMEVGRRAGVAIEGVGMPGHFLVRDVSEGPAAGDAGVWCDPFGGFARLDRDGCRAIFDRVYGGRVAFDPSYLTGVSAHATLARMLANLEQGPLAADPAQLAWMSDLHLALPDLTAAERARITRTRAAWN